MRKLLATGVAAMVLTFAGAALADTGANAGHDDHPYMEKTLAQLPPQKADQFRQAMKQAHEQNKALQGQAHKLHDELQAILVAPKFDKDAYLAKKTQLQQVYDQMHTATAQAFASSAAQLTQSERKTLADAMQERAERWRHQHEGKKAPDSGATPPTDAQ